MKVTITVTLTLCLLTLRSFGQCNLTNNLALNRPAYASSAVSPAYQAFDGNTGTSWSTAGLTPQYIYVDLGTTYSLCQVVLNWSATAYASAFTIDVSSDASTWTTVYSVSSNSATTNTISLSTTGRYVRTSANTEATIFGFTINEFQVYGSSSACGTTNIALSRPVTASSAQLGLPASNAVDGSISTRWSSVILSDPQYIYVDLGSTQPICEVSLYWQTSMASSFNVDVSNNAGTWTTLASVTGNASPINNIGVSASARYVRMNGLSRTNLLGGYSLSEFQVFGPIPLPVDFEYFTGAYVNQSYVSLQWATDGERDNDHFDVERSGDGVNFVSLETVPGSGTSSLVQEYQARDPYPLDGANYYRLRQVDKNGASNLSALVYIYAPQPDLDLSVYPNPVKDFIQIRAKGGALIQRVDLFSVLGEPLVTYTNPLGTTSAQLGVVQLPAGVYFLHVITNRETRVFKVLK
jgi:hypothetical protein